ncbi:MAG: flagellar hook-associated protein 3 [Candidatus Margulisiibacteriota bacterium]|nr:MAG: flagellar hook-associated protein 3 [Candidatus Margulisbacteria bacterium GWD2_39_127]OGI03918.1 MAG: flagellar hook-associated protein 3 [Candidatus Margulisbacteria bacterium GWF2_38_17]OGI08188.1 MAG: flagellar hook-associated protein 3 [Candidatus Margulisbacteria bacterium GWE2_39_32]PZM78610.1 MAG: flagellar hook-associated protein 3 [Candidatus Margulisiibacteriota bacterium]HAR61949.1 flagellar hook-associated protein 3 [Candidatus Margulisiibacteriota bacterium]
MRVSNSYIFFSLKNQLSSNLENLYNSQVKVNSGKKYVLPSDDPTSAVTALRIKHSLNLNSYYKERQNYTKPYLQIADTQLTTIINTIRTVKVDLNMASNSTNDNSQLAIVATKIDKAIDSIVTTANAKYNNTFLFGGYGTNTTPFVRTGDQVKYNGSGHTVQQEINKDIFADVMIPGSKIFETHTVDSTIGLASPDAKLSTMLNSVGSPYSFSIKTGSGTPATFSVNYTTDSLQDIVTRINNSGVDVKANIKEANGMAYLTLQSKIVGESGALTITDDSSGNGLLKAISLADENAAITGTQSSYSNGLLDTLIAAKNKLQIGDTTGLSDLIAKIDSANDNILNITANVGYEIQRIETAQSFSSDEEFRLKELLSDTEGIDSIGAITELSTLQNAYEAALATSARIMKLSLLNYI